MKLTKWVKKQINILMLALSNVEKNALGQTSPEMASNVNQVQRHKQGMLSDALIRGEITQEVKIIL